MKILRTSIVVVLFSSIAFTGFAQKERSVIPKWVSDKGYWVVESNTKTPLYHIIRFYTNENVLMYTEILNSIKLNPDKRKVKMKLKKVLESTVANWEIRKIAEEDKAYVARQLK